LCCYASTCASAQKHHHHADYIIAVPRAPSRLAGARPPGASGPALAHRCQNRRWGLGQKCSFIYLCTAAFCPAVKAAVPATVQIASCGCSPRTLASASAQQELVVAGRSYVPSEGAGAHACQ